jgi:hypothetical protein
MMLGWPPLIHQVAGAVKVAAQAIAEAITWLVEFIKDEVWPS